MPSDSHLVLSHYIQFYSFPWFVIMPYWCPNLVLRFTLLLERSLF